VNQSKFRAEWEWTQGRILGMEAAMNVTFREWNSPPGKVMAYLRETSERLMSTMLASHATDAAIAGMKHAMGEAVAALQGRIDFPHQ
jgi:hypothetical protein